MGLDMYLHKRTYVKAWDHHSPEKRRSVTVKVGAEPHPDIKPERIAYVIEEVAYWRKANAIHAWFVQHVQKGVDDCGEYRVSREQLEELKAACDKVLRASKLKAGKINNGYTVTITNGETVKKDIVEDGEVLADPQIAETVLPTQGGFFFGSTDYDSYYLEDIKQTSEVLGALLAEPDEDEDWYYQSSW